MQPISEDEEHRTQHGITQRTLVVAVDDSAESERALAWVVDEMFRYEL